MIGSIGHITFITMTEIPKYYAKQHPVRPSRECIAATTNVSGDMGPNAMIAIVNG